MSNTHARLFLSFEQDCDDRRCIEGIVATHAAYMDALERVLGAPANSFARISAEAVNAWVAALRAHPKNNHAGD
jgi:hypothetical protein